MSMKLLALALAIPVAVVAIGKMKDKDEIEFRNWMQRYHKSYASSRERNEAFDAFKQNLHTVRRTNAQDLLYKLDLNAYADITPQQFAATYGMSREERKGLVFDGLPLLGAHVPSNETASLPSSLDWRQHNAVTAVGNQGACGACWAFAASGAMEGAWSIATKGMQLLSLSEQQLLDCDTNAIGCKGGSPQGAWQSVTTEAVCTSGSYTYTEAKGTCRSKDCIFAIPQGGIVGFKSVKVNDAQALMDAVAQQPVAVGLDGDDQFQLYKSGILTTCGTQVDHSVLLIGYGRQGSQDYWLLKNSWGPDWGESGYARILRGVGGSGECAILSDGSYPVVNASKVNPNMNPFPLGNMILAVLGVIAMLIFAVWGCNMLRKRYSRPGGGVAARSPATRATAMTAASRPLATSGGNVLQPVSTAPAASVDPNVRRGNSAASRLLQGSSSA